MIILVVACLLSSGCSSTRWAEIRRRPLNPLSRQFDLDSHDGPSPTPRTLQTLRRNNVQEIDDINPLALVSALQDIAIQEPSADNVYTIAEVAYVAAEREEGKGRLENALDLHGTVVANSYFYLFDNSLHPDRNEYDPRFRLACDLYNESLEKGLRFLEKQGALVPGTTHSFETDGQIVDVTVAARGTWHERNFDQLKFVSDFKVKELKNHYRSYGLGVPLIATYKCNRGYDAADRFYPPGMSFPVTAFLRVVGSARDKGKQAQRARHACVIELHDPTVTSHLVINNEQVPLETDLTTPLAYSLDNPAFKKANVPTRGLRDVQESTAVSGLYMLEPYDPNKIPVVMVHGFWSSLVTWMEMFNDLRGTESIRDRYQFWFYLYPTGPPFWYTAARLRQELAELRNIVDPDHESPTLDQMVLVGHSMGGLIAEMQTMESDEAFWRLVSEKPFAQITCDPEVHDNLHQAFFFTPNPSIRRVISIAAPHKGSNFSNMTTQWIGRKLINLPEHLVATRNKLLQENPSFFVPGSLLSVTTAIEALATTAPTWEFMHEARRAPWVTYHNIIGHVEDNQLLAAVAKDSDGVVTTDSAAHPFASSEITVPAEHTQVHRHPAAILEVQRILLEHLQSLGQGTAHEASLAEAPDQGS